MMGMEPVRLKTRAETRLAEQFASLGAVSPIRSEAFSQFEAGGLPSKRVEEYHFTDLRRHLHDVLPLLQPDTTGMPISGPIIGDEIRIVIRDGEYDPALSDPLPNGVTLLMEETKGEVPTDPVLALNLAFCARELHLEIAAGVAVEKPIRLQVQSSSTEGRSIYRRTRITLNEGASLTLLETADGTMTPNQANVVLSLVLADRASLNHIARIEAGQGLVLNSVVAEVGAHCSLASFAFLSGGQLLRRQMFVRLLGAHSDLNLSGISLLNGLEHIDTTLVVAHEAPHCTSRETFRHIIDGEATGVFQGKIIVKPGAQKTDGKMMSKAVLLSEAAVMDNKPELEIFADDVVCGHGATVGALDEDQLFYAQARGIPRPSAEALLLEAFAGEVIDTISHPDSSESLRDDLRVWLSRRKS